MNENEKFLPIGTIVLLKDATKKLMITGFLPISHENELERYDYSACFYPEGNLLDRKTIVFNHENIAKIISKGYIDSETSMFLNQLKEIDKTK